MRIRLGAENGGGTKNGIWILNSSSGVVPFGAGESPARKEKRGQIFESNLGSPGKAEIPRLTFGPQGSPVRPQPGRNDEAPGAGEPLRAAARGRCPRGHQGAPQPSRSARSPGSHPRGPETQAPVRRQHLPAAVVTPCGKRLPGLLLSFPLFVPQWRFKEPRGRMCGLADARRAPGPQAETQRPRPPAGPGKAPSARPAPPTSPVHPAAPRAMPGRVRPGRLAHSSAYLQSARRRYYAR